ncbi:MAG: exopolyphosphatase [Candidatus Eremiobacteraeota bacterium]|nr:exopolyphosphatase [Candidatus Eremiobacteraeota bacterium]
MRLVTRSDFDGLICAVILKESGVIDSYQFVHPKDVQDGKVAITENDVIANIPYWPGCGMWFDHHSSENDVMDLFGAEFKGESRPEKSCARIIYEFYGGKAKYPQYEEMLVSVDKSDSGDLTIEDILDPQRWMLLSFVMDPRTGLGRYKDYTISNYKLMEDLIEYCRNKPIEEILELPDVKERIDRYKKHQKKYEAMIKKNATVHRNCLVIDLREVEKILVGNRFVEYALFPEVNISMRVIWGKTRDTVAFAIGHSVLNRSSKTDVGAIAREYGGGGHHQVGTCQVPADRCEEVRADLLLKIVRDG